MKEWSCALQIGIEPSLMSKCKLVAGVLVDKMSEKTHKVKTRQLRVWLGLAP